MSHEQSGSRTRDYSGWSGSNNHLLRRGRKLLLAAVLVITVMGIVGGLRWQHQQLQGGDGELVETGVSVRNSGGAGSRPGGVGSRNVKVLPPSHGNVAPTHQHHSPTAVVEELGEGAPPRLFVITVQTSASPGWCKMLLSHFLTTTTTTTVNRTSGSSVMMYNIGWGEAYGHAKRPAWILQWASDPALGLRDSDVVMFVDGSDTMFTGVPMEEILAKFVARTLPREPSAATTTPPTPPALPALLFNAEANCYHQQTFSGPWGVKKGRCILAYDELHRQWAEVDSTSVTTKEDTSSPLSGNNYTSPSSSIQISKFRYLNAGAWIGRVWAVKKVFTEANRQIQAGKGKFWCDQSIIGGILLSRKYNHRTTMGIDTQNAFFLPTYHVRYKADICPFSGGGEVEGAGGVRRVRMCHSGETPALMHFNGKSGGPLHRLLLGNTSWWQPEGDTRSEQVRQVLQVDTSTRLVSLTGGVTTRVVSLSTHCPSPQYPQG